MTIALPRQKLFLLSGVLGCCLSVSVGALLVNSKTVSPRLALSLQQEGDRLQVQWNRANAMVQNARVGVLAIHDGSQDRKVYLTPEQISDGSVLYMPQSDDISFRLEVYGQDGGTESQSLRLLDGARAAQMTAAEMRDDTPVPIPMQPKARIVRVRAEPPKKFKAPMVLSTTAPKAGGVPDGPPVIDANWAGTEPNIASLFPVNQPAPPPPPPAPEPVKREVVSAYIPARIVQRVLPQTAGLASAIRTGETVELVVTVDTTGNVGGIRLLAPKNISPLVLRSVVQAANAWKFAPATLHGAPVRSEHRIAFQFSQ